MANVFINNGKGVRGDLSAVVRAILLDSNARQAGDNPDGGKEREPYLRLVALVRAFNGKANNKDGIFEVAYLDDLVGQETQGARPVSLTFISPITHLLVLLLSTRTGLRQNSRSPQDAVTCVSVANFLRDCIYHDSIGPLERKHSPRFQP